MVTPITLSPNLSFRARICLFHSSASDGLIGPLNVNITTSCSPGSRPSLCTYPPLIPLSFADHHLPLWMLSTVAMTTLARHRQPFQTVRICGREEGSNGLPPAWSSSSEQIP